jgi:multiple sugar transport system permease protein
MAASLIVVLPAIILFAIGQKYFMEGIALTGIKG